MGLARGGLARGSRKDFAVGLHSWVSVIIIIITICCYHYYHYDDDDDDDYYYYYHDYIAFLLRFTAVFARRPADMSSKAAVDGWQQGLEGLETAAGRHWAPLGSRRSSA